MIEYFNGNLYAFWFTAGFVLLALEALVFGFSSGVVLFSGLGALITGGLMWAGLLPPTWLAGIASFGVCSAGITTALWKPLKKLQDNKNKISTKDASSDLIGYEFRLAEKITTLEPGRTRYSGIDWRVEIDGAVPYDTLTKGEKVTVVSVDAGIFRVVPINTKEENENPDNIL